MKSGVPTWEIDFRYWHSYCYAKEDMRSYSRAKSWNIFRFVFLFLSTLSASTICLADNAPPNGTLPTSQEPFSQIPQHQLVRPNWAIGVNVTLNAFGGKGIVSDQGSNPAYGVTLLAEYQPAFLQSIGVLGFGPAVSLYPMSAGGITPSMLSIFSAGGQIRYQARFFRQQPVVPVFAYQLEYLKYQLSAGNTGTLLLSGPSIGLWFFLNIIEPSSAAQMYVSTKIARSYLTFEWRNMPAEDSTVRISGGTYYFGLRFEF